MTILGNIKVSVLEQALLIFIHHNYLIIINVIDN